MNWTYAGWGLNASPDCPVFGDKRLNTGLGLSGGYWEASGNRGTVESSRVEFVRKLEG